jgi:hypothetical protein
MGSGGKKAKEAPPVTAPVFNTDPSAYGGIGYSQVPNTFTPQNRPDWMQGHFAMPTWGTSATRDANGNNVALTQGMLQPGGQGIHQQALDDPAGYAAAPMTLDQARAMYAPQQPQMSAAMLSRLNTPRAGKGMNQAQALTQAIMPTSFGG